MAAKRCHEFENEPGFPGHCDSCHEDWNLGYETPLEEYDPKTDELVSLTCCRVHEWLEKRAADTREAGK